jgi:hypothetical protein
MATRLLWRPDFPIPEQKAAQQTPEHGHIPWVLKS